MRLVFVCAAVSFLMACGGESASDSGAPPQMDGSLGRDAGSGPRDGGFPADAGTSADAGPVPDGGLPVDAGPTADADTSADAAPDASMLDAGPEPCDSPGSLEELPCGRCGTVSRFCTSERAWEYADCEGESGECLPGTTQMGDCGDCGEAREVCTDSCEWEEVGECMSEGECTPGALENRDDGCATGTRDFRCSETCAFEPVSECATDPCPTPGVTESVPCGDCGVRTRFCTSANEWEYGACGSEGECSPGSRQDVECGRCGTQAQRCNASCAWADFDSCSSEGECTPGSMSTTTDGCSGIQQRPTTCSDMCEYEPTGSCATPTGMLGETCSASTCESGLVCSSTTGIPICRETCEVDGDCTAPRACFGADMFCGDACTPFTDDGCPGGSKCDFLGYSGDIGFPFPLGGPSLLVCSAVGTEPAGATCVTNSECQRQHVCLLDSGGVTGRCTQFCDLTHPCDSGTCSGTLGVLGFCE